MESNLEVKDASNDKNITNLAIQRRRLIELEKLRSHFIERMREGKHPDKESIIQKAESLKFFPKTLNDYERFCFDISGNNPLILSAVWSLVMGILTYDSIWEFVSMVPVLNDDFFGFQNLRIEIMKKALEKDDIK